MKYRIEFKTLILACVPMFERHCITLSEEHAEETMLCRANTFVPTILVRNAVIKLISFGNRSYNMT